MRYAPETHAHLSPVERSKNLSSRRRGSRGEAQRFFGCGTVFSLQRPEMVARKKFHAETQSRREPGDRSSAPMRLVAKLGAPSARRFHPLSAAIGPRVRTQISAALRLCV